MDKTIRRWYRDSVLTNGYKHRAPGTLQRLFQVEVGRFVFFLCVYFWLQREVKASFVLSLHPFQSVLLFLDLWNLAVAAGTCWGDTWAPERFQAERRSALVKTPLAHPTWSLFFCLFFFYCGNIWLSELLLASSENIDILNVIKLCTFPLRLLTSFRTFSSFNRISTSAQALQYSVDLVGDTVTISLASLPISSELAQHFMYSEGSHLFSQRTGSRTYVFFFIIIFR